MERANRLRACVVSAIGISLATLVFGCQPPPSEGGNKGSPNADTGRDRRLDMQALRSIPHGHHKRACPDASPGRARCHAQVRTDPEGTVEAFAAPSGLNPVDLQSAYAAPGGGSDLTVGIVDAYDDPNAEADLAVYRAQFGLPPCTTANGCFKKVNQKGAASPLPKADSGWALEISLDLQMVSAVCPTCKIVLVEANSNSNGNLGTAENTAARLGVAAISNSFGGTESFLVSGYDSQYYNHPGILITASTGDNGYGVEYPASGAHVLGVGGTSLVRSDSSRGWAEAAWSGAGSGCSAYIAKPSFQTDTGCSKRSVADVSAVADPNTGASVYDTYGYSGWIVVGGTSAAAPIVAATFAAAHMADVGNSYPYSSSTAFYDVTSGTNGTCSTPYLCNGQAGYDGPTGIGTPNGAAIAAGCGSGTPPPLASVTATDGTYSDKVRVSWATWCATSYQVFRNTTNSTTGATQIATSSAPPYDDASASLGVTYYYFVKACSSSGCSDFSPSDSGYRSTAVYDATLLAPKCGTPSPFCDSGDLLVGRATLGPEPNAPNTIASSPCSDGTAGNFHSDESIDRLRISSLDGTDLAPGESARVDATVWAYTTDANSDPDYLDLYLTTDATEVPPVWTLLTPTSLVPSTTGAGVLSQTIMLPTTGGTQWAIRGNFRYNDSAHSTCSTGDYDDRDDLVFVVVISPPSPIPGVSASDGTYTDKVEVSWTASGDATSYQVYRNTSDSSSGSTQIGTPTESPFDDTTATPGAIYYYFVKACNAGGCSDFGTSDSGYRAISAPADVSASDGTYTDEVQVSWTVSNGADSYQVYRNTSDSSSDSTQIGTPTASPYDDTTAAPGATYYYFVKACNGAVCSDFSTSDSGYRLAAPPEVGDAGLDGGPDAGVATMQYSEDFESGVGGWADSMGTPPVLASDPTSASGPGVMTVARTTAGGDYFSPAITVTGGQTYCVSAAVKWSGGGTPFVGLQPSTSTVPIWLIGASGYQDAFGPVQAVSASETGWQEFQYTVVMPAEATQAWLNVELFSGVTKPGENLAYFDGFAISEGACVPPTSDAGVSADSSVPPVYSIPYVEQFESGIGGWADKLGASATLASDGTSPAGSAVLSVARAAAGGDYFSPAITVTGGQTYCVSAALKWSGGGAPFVGLQPSTSTVPIWLIGASGYQDAFGPVQAVSVSETGWQQFQYTVVMPAEATQAWLNVELFSGETKPGADLAYFDGFAITEGACAPPTSDAGVSADSSVPPIYSIPYVEQFESGTGGWADKLGANATLASDGTSPAGSAVLSVARATGGGDYFSPAITVTGGQTYCVSAALKWLGGGTPFVGLQPSTSTVPIWLIGASGYQDAFGPVQAVSVSETGWQEFQYTVVMPAEATQAWLNVELFSGETKPGADLAYFDGFSLTSGVCAQSLSSSD